MTRDLPIDEDGDFLMQTWAVYRKMSAEKTPPEVTALPFVVGLQARIRPFDMHHALYRWDGEAARTHFDKETLLIRGLEDLYSGDVAARHAQMGNSTYVEIPEGGAWLFYEQPEACAKVVREFLEA
jgi:pimeloyl-ACP methyl ester carboxylesterase